ncbi:acetyl/propionyl/methylcrotonyl-CoA carboxylase subunit alpha [Rhizobium sp. Leaf262]|uniref:acetyl/propionyl/methylcrotonyl-CoA carboxylase subunit alpha n=1 Tax=Rhizobium sp. Leaf262 TaxID=1736312 RepID=UPI0007125D0F|nr:acetyl/propionyl/methylcrotonyl-CoA carboxylase subunit alpha [Rhizobium sp. Leaf262]KQO77633.1 3-methylcrotonyl-CoA carboxylase [Rhizobium sp. Leaf262]
MFTKILIANRGEITCRVIVTARRMGIKTVAVYSDADAGALHVQMADEAVRIGPPAVAESYLNGTAIIDAALKTGAQAIHPGYGFLSENPEFVEAVEKAGLVFIGPPPDAIRAMGLKDFAKARMESAGVPVVPGYHGPVQDADFLAEQARKIGYPVLIKARAGGGGKGMRLVEKPDDFASALESAQREGTKSFGDAAVLVEKYVASPRHIEMQIFADNAGHVVHLFERDCSLQRRHQKVIEEAPAPGMTQEMRHVMGEAAIEAARAIGYRGAGTIEFIADSSRGLRPDGFWFMEMNTRLQVEHPVSEAITGLDFVELQLRVAAGEPLPFTQQDLSITGHAFEARLYAEDPATGFLPATGKLDHLKFPEAAKFEQASLRIDSGVRAGDTITPWYDPMIAKVIVHGQDREDALHKLADALTSVEIAGTVTNLTFLAALSRHDGFRRGQIDTGLIGRDLTQLLEQPPAPAFGAVVAAMMFGEMFDSPTGRDPFDLTKGFRLWGPAELHVTLNSVNGREAVDLMINGAMVETADGATYRITKNGDDITIDENGYRQRLRAVRIDEAVHLFIDGHVFSWTRPDALTRIDETHVGSDTVAAPMPGLVAKLFVSRGQAVSKGDALLVLEAMKMEHALSAPRDGVVQEINVAAGQQVAHGDTLIALETDHG